MFAAVGLLVWFVAQNWNSSGVSDGFGIENRLVQNDENGNGKTDPQGNPAAKVVDGKKVVAAENAQVIDLLKLIDPKKHKVAGNWSLQGTALVTHGGPYCCMQIPFAPPEEYQLNITVTRLTGKQGLHLGLVKGERQFSVVLDSSGRNTALHVLDRTRQFTKNVSAFDGPLLKEGVPTEIECKVHKTGVSVTVKGQTVIEWGRRLLTSFTIHWLF